MNAQLYFWAKMVIFCIKHLEKEKNTFNIIPTPSPNYPFACRCVLIFHIIYVNSVLGLVGAGDDYPQTKMRGLGEPEHLVL